MVNCDINTYSIGHSGYDHKLQLEHNSLVEDAGLQMLTFYKAKLVGGICDA
jgi:hypothetical protein